MLTASRSAERQLSPEQILAVRSELKAVLEGESFSTSQRCRDFLETIVEQTLDGEADSLTERFLGVRLFARAADYETATDSIVRVRANDVRRRLAQHYSSTGPARMVRIELHVGRYVPEFHWLPTPEAAAFVAPVGSPPIAGDRSLARAVAGPTAEEASAVAPQTSRRMWIRGIAVGGSLVLLALVMLSYRMMMRSNLDAFWQPVLDAPGQPVLSLPSTDTFHFTQDAARTLTPLNRLQPGQTVQVGPADVLAFHDFHVSLPVVQATLAVANILERRGKVPLLRIGTDVRRDELRGHAIIAIGSFSNPWTEQNVSGLRFTFDRGSDDLQPPRIRDAQNPQRSWSLPHTYPEHQEKDYAIITRTFDPVTHEPFVSLAGLHSFGNQMAGEFVSQEASWNEVARRAQSGWRKMNLQILLEAEVVGTTPGSSKIVDMYFWR